MNSHRRVDAQLGVHPYPNEARKKKGGHQTYWGIRRLEGLGVKGAVLNTHPHCSIVASTRYVILRRLQKGDVNIVVSKYYCRLNLLSMLNVRSLCVSAQFCFYWHVLVPVTLLAHGPAAHVLVGRCTLWVSLRRFWREAVCVNAPTRSSRPAAGGSVCHCRHGPCNEAEWHSRGLTSDEMVKYCFNCNLMHWYLMNNAQTYSNDWIIKII